jgi:ABC-type amino acid transport system permease subunit
MIEMGFFQTRASYSLGLSALTRAVYIVMLLLRIVPLHHSKTWTTIKETFLKH